MHTQLRQFLQTMVDAPDDELEQMGRLFRPASLARGAFFIQAGEQPQTLGFVLSGLLRLYYIDEAGGEYTKAFCVENSFVAAYSALLLGEPSRLFIEALEESALLVADYSAYQSLAAGSLRWQIMRGRLAEALFIRKEKREGELVLDDATARYRRFLAEYPGLEPRLKQYHIASYLGISPVSLSRIRRQIQREK